MCLRRLAGVTAGIHHVGAERRRDAGKVEPVRAFKNHIPVEVGGSGLLNGRMRPVINANGTALRRAFLIIGDTDTVASTHDHRGIHAVAAQRVDRSLSDGMRGQFGDVDGVKAVVSQRNSYVSFPATERKLQVVRLNKALVIVWLETNHSTAQYPTAIQLSTLIKRGPEEIFLRPQNRRLQLILTHKMSIGPINGEELICCTPTDVIWVLRYLI